MRHQGHSKCHGREPNFATISEQLVTTSARIQEHPRIELKFLDALGPLPRQGPVIFENDGPFGRPRYIKDNLSKIQRNTAPPYIRDIGPNGYRECCGTPTGGYPWQNGDIRIRGPLSGPNVKPA